MDKVLTTYEQYNKGDWVCFMGHGQLTIGEIMYIAKDAYASQYRAYTTAGMVSLDAILEVRKVG